MGDLNQDGRQDVVFANQDSARVGRTPGSYIYWGSTDFYGDRHRSTVPTVGAVGCRIADLDGDGHPDLIFATAGEKGGLEVYWGREKGPDPESPARFPIPGLVSLETARIGDLTNGAGSAVAGPKLRNSSSSSRAGRSCKERP